MSKITAIRVGRGRGKRVNMFLDGKVAFSLEAEVVVKEGLQVGQELSVDQIEAYSVVTFFFILLICQSGQAQPETPNAKQQ